MKIKSISSVKDPVKLKRQTIDWEKIFSNSMSNKELVSRIYLKKEKNKLKIKPKLENPIRK